MSSGIKDDYFKELEYVMTNLNETNLDFGSALRILQGRDRVARAGWNGKGMYLELVGSEDYNVDPAIWDGQGLPWIGMKTADNKFVPWLASQTDILATDWCHVPRK